MTASQSLAKMAVKAKASAFGNYIDPERMLADLPNMVLVELDLPEYERNGLGRMVAKTLRYEFVDLNQHGCEAMSIGAERSRGHMIYTDMKPVVVGTLKDVEMLAPDVAKFLMERRYGPEMVAVGVLRAASMGLGVATSDEQARLVAFLNKYHRRATWLETHPMDVRMANMEAMIGEGAAFDWARIFPSVETGEL
jgi:hypothetical protein